MITKMFIWFHRRRAAHHAALKINGAVKSSPFDNDYVHLSDWHASYEQWHLEQIKRLEKNL